MRKFPEPQAFYNGVMRLQGGEYLPFIGTSNNSFAYRLTIGEKEALIKPLKLLSQSRYDSLPEGEREHYFDELLMFINLIAAEDFSPVNFPYYLGERYDALTLSRREALAKIETGTTSLDNNSKWFHRKTDEEIAELKKECRKNKRIVLETESRMKALSEIQALLSGQDIYE